MKKIFILLGLLWLEAFAFSQDTILTFKLANPRTIRRSGSDRFEVDLQVKANVSGTFLWSGKAYISYNTTTFSTLVDDWSFNPATILTALNASGVAKYTIAKNPSGSTPFYATWTASAASSLPPSINNFASVTTSFQTLGTFSGKIASAAGVAGIDFIESSMNNQQFYKSNAGFRKYNFANAGVNNYNTADLLTTYVGRVYSAIYGWSQTGGGTNGSQYINWSVPMNTSVWDTNGSGPAHIQNAGSVAANLRVHSRARLVIDPGKNLSCSGATVIESARGLIIGSSSGTAQFLDNGVTYGSGNTGTVQVYSAFTRDAWHLYSIPVIDPNAAPFAGIYMKYYKEGNDRWKFVTDPDTIILDDLKGYAMWSSSLVPVSPNFAAPEGKLYGTPATSALLTASPATNLLYAGYNLIGNPYTCEIDLYNINWGSAIHQAWFWIPADGNYSAFPSAGNDYGTHSQYAAAQQAFFVKTAVNNTAVIIPQAAKRIGTEPFVKNSINDLLFVEATASQSAKKDKMSVYFKDGATSGFDELFDTDKMYGDFDAPQLYSILPGAINLTVNGLPWKGNAQLVPLGFSCGVAGDYTITASNIESFGAKHIYLEDKRLGFWQNLTENPVYTFRHETSNDPGRFVIHFTLYPIGINEKEACELMIYSNESSFYVMNQGTVIQKGRVELYDMTGREIFSDVLQNNKVSKFNPGVVEGYYAVRVLTASGMVCKKIWLK